MCLAQHVSTKKPPTLFFQPHPTTYPIINNYYNVQPLYYSKPSYFWDSRVTPGWYRQKFKKMLSNTLRLNFCYLKIIHIFHPPYHPKTIGPILKNKQMKMYAFIHEIVRLIIMKMKMKMKNRSHRYHINRLKSRYGHKHRKYKECLSMMIPLCIK